MQKNKRIGIRLTELEFELMKGLSDTMGYKGLSDYIRDKCLGKLKYTKVNSNETKRK